MLQFHKILLHTHKFLHAIFMAEISCYGIILAYELKNCILPTRVSLVLPTWVSLVYKVVKYCS